MSLLKALFGPSKKQVMWRQIADQLGGRFVERGLMGTDVVQVSTDEWIITLDTFTAGENSPTYTRMRAPYVNPDGFRFTIFRRGVFSDIARALGMQDVEVGHPFFDHQFVIKGSSPDRLRSLFANDRLRSLIEAQPKIRLDVKPDEGWFSQRFPDGVDELHFQAVGVITDLDRLRGLFDLFAEALRQITHDGSAYDDDVGLHVARLRGPGGRIRQKRLTLWEGDAPRREAADALGRMGDPRAIGALVSALADPDWPLRARAVRALGRIGHEWGVRPLIPMLASEREIDGTAIGDWAATALTELGHGSLAAAVRQALEGEMPTDFEQSVEAFRPQVLRALVNALHEPTGGHAATALGELRAVESLPAMRDALRLVGSSSSRGIAIAAAIRELEARAALPRPAEAPPARRTTLPRAAREPGPAGDTLPRPARDD